jgi:hypothetical protein
LIADLFPSLNGYQTFTKMGINMTIIVQNFQIKEKAESGMPDTISLELYTMS